jgi:hypothetical protein
VGKKEKTAAVPQQVREQKGSGVRARINIEGERTSPERSSSVADLGTPPAPVVSVQGVPHLLLSPDEVAALPLDNRLGFVVALVDGKSTMDEILDLCPLTHREALQMMRHLVAMKIVAFGPPSKR